MHFSKERNCKREKILNYGERKKKNNVFGQVALCHLLLLLERRPNIPKDGEQKAKDLVQKRYIEGGTKECRKASRKKEIYLKDWGFYDVIYCKAP